MVNALVPTPPGIETRSEGASASILLIHGFASRPTELRTLIDFLHDHKFSTFAVQLAGHGTTPEELAETSCEDMYQSVINGIQYIQSWDTPFHFVIGHSLGGAFAIRLAAEYPAFDGLVLIAPLIQITSGLIRLLPLLKHFIKYKAVDLRQNERICGYDIPRERYDRDPLVTIYEIYQFSKTLGQYIPRVELPLCVLQGTADKTLPPEPLYRAFPMFGSQKKVLHKIPDGEHVLFCHPTRRIAYPLILDFLNEVMDEGSVTH